MEQLLKVSNLKVRFDGRLVLDDISFEVKEDETLAIIGPNGAGKTVLFKALLGLIPFEGEVKWTRDITIGYVPQRLPIEPDLPLTTAEFFELKDKDKNEVSRVLTAVGFDDEKLVLKRKLGILSGGELQRVMIAWALLGHPRVLLFDEPTSGVDISGEKTIYGLLHKLQDQEKLTVILISHELQVVFRYANMVVCLNKERVCYGPPSEVLDGKSLAKLYGTEVGLYHHHDEHGH